jgi:hypothetical protein
VAATLPPRNASPGTVHRLEFQVGRDACTAGIGNLVIAGWTGRDRERVDEHIAELAAVGVRRPSTVPCFYRVGANLLTHASAIDVMGSTSSGEVEVVLVSLANGLHVAVGSDHTDRKVEAYSVTASKQMCPKPIGRELWPFSEVEDHWDDLVLRSWLTCQGTRELYQEGSVTNMLAAPDLIERYLGRRGPLPAGTAMFCGTLTAIGPIRGGDGFEIELEDPRMKRTLQHAYVARYLEIVD